MSPPLRDLALPGLACCLLLALVPGIARAQSFIAPVSELPSPPVAVVDLVDGTTLEGDIKSYMLMNGTLRSFTLQDAAGTKHKLKAEQIDTLKVRMTGLAKVLTVLDATDQDLASLAGRDFKEISNREYVIFRQALLPKKQDRYALLQQLNPGWDSRLRVFVDPDTADASGTDRSFLVVKDGQKSLVAQDRRYDKDAFPALFSDCPGLFGLPQAKKKVKYDDFAAHVWIFESLCGAPEAEAPASETPAPAPETPAPAEDEPAAPVEEP